LLNPGALIQREAKRKEIPEKEWALPNRKRLRLGSGIPTGRLESFWK